MNHKQDKSMVVLMAIGVAIIWMFLAAVVISIFAGCAAPRRAAPTDLKDSVSRMPFAAADTTILYIEIGRWWPVPLEGRVEFTGSESALRDSIITSTFRYEDDN